MKLYCCSHDPGLFNYVMPGLKWSFDYVMPGGTASTAS